MLMLTVTAALVLDFGVVRLDRQQNKLAADAAVAAGLQAADKGTGDFYNATAVCAAYEFLKANREQLSGLPAGVCAAPSAAQVCVPGSPGTDFTYNATTTSGNKSFEVWIKSSYKVGEATGGGTFPDETSMTSLAADTGDSVKQGCDQLAVIIRQKTKPGLGQLISSGDLVSRTRSVGRVSDGPPESPYALLILERHDCDALANASGGAGGRIDVTGFDTHPAMIHVDSDGTGSQCPSKPIVEGKNPGTCPDPALPAAPTCGGVVAHEAPVGGSPGQITVVGTSNVSDGTPKTYAGPYPGTSPKFRDQVSRKVLDKVYLQGVTNAVSAAAPSFTAAAAGTAPAGYASYDCTVTGTITVTKAFVKCANFNKDVTFSNATDVIFTGQVSSDKLSMPVATRVYIVGGTSPAGVSVGTTFAVHDNNAASCPSAYSASAGRAQLFIKNGSLKTAGGSYFRACNTTVIMMGGDTGACLPSTSPYAVTYTSTPCPSSPAAGNGTLDMSGNGTIDWTAPNNVDDLVKATDADHLNLEDLALWDETYDTQNVGGGGYMHLSGVFAAPNAVPFKLNGGATQDVKNSQYVVRQLWSTGNGTLSMQPLPSLPVAPPKFEYTMVR